MIQSNDSKDAHPKPDAKQGATQGYIPKFTIIAFNNLSQEIKQQPRHIICSMV
jgi:hypothetical protein